MKNKLKEKKYMEKQEGVIKKPVCKLTGKNGNIFNLLGLACSVLKENRQYLQSKEMKERVFNCGSYDEALAVIGEYVDIK